jgi:nicotinamidase/pyrazinamidase
MKRVLICVDVQNDFADPSGRLYCAGGELVPGAINHLIEKVQFDCLVLTQDFHTANHMSFSNDIPFQVRQVNNERGYCSQTFWPSHCVQGTEGVEFCDTLDTDKFHIVIRKGTDPLVDSYSAFFSNKMIQTDGSEKMWPTGLHRIVKDWILDWGKTEDIELYFVGLATDVCVKYSIMDFLDFSKEHTDLLRAVTGREGNIVFPILVTNCCVGVTEEGHNKAIEELTELGVRCVGEDWIENV